MNILNAPNLNFLWGRLILEELRRCGVACFALAPGSRCAPLSAALADQEERGMNPVIHYDERGLGYYAMGHAAATGQPSAVITTSGTAVANLMPAVVEASKKKIPLIVVSADRPPELRNTGANQTIDQPGIFGKYVRFEFDLPCPTFEIQPEAVLTTVDQIVHRARGNPPGPVHLNCMFREPLSPVRKEGAKLKTYVRSLSSWAKTKQPYTRYLSGTKTLDPKTVQEAAGRIKKIRNGVIVVGKLSAGEHRDVLRLARRLNWPVLPDITSGLRLGDRGSPVVPYFDQLLAKFPYNVDGVLHLGGRITSKRWYEFVQAASLKEYVTVLNHPLRNDPLHCVTLRIESPVGAFCEQLRTKIPARKADARISLLRRESQDFAAEGLTEPAAARMISEMIPKGSGLFLASSLPVREMDAFASAKGAEVVVSSNRGASGIDGTVASAAGFASGLKKPVTLVIGDLALLHDLNSLSLAVRCERPLVIVAFNNDGGQIFTKLPIARTPGFAKTLKRFFVAPHGLTFGPMAEAFGLKYAAPETSKDFARDYRAALKEQRTTLIELRTKP